MLPEVGTPLIDVCAPCVSVLLVTGENEAVKPDMRDIVMAPVGSVGIEDVSEAGVVMLGRATSPFIGRSDGIVINPEERA